MNFTIIKRGKLQIVIIRLYAFHLVSPAVMIGSFYWEANRPPHTNNMLSLQFIITRAGHC